MKSESMKYSPVSIHRERASILTSCSSAPAVLIRANPLIPWVDGNNWASTFQKAGIFDDGQDMPLMNISGTDTNTNSRKQDSLSLTKNDMQIAKNMLDNRNGMMNATNVGNCQSCGIWNSHGTKQST